LVTTHVPEDISTQHSLLPFYTSSPAVSTVLLLTLVTTHVSSASFHKFPFGERFSSSCIGNNTCTGRHINSAWAMYHLGTTQTNVTAQPWISYLNDHRGLRLETPEINSKLYRIMVKMIKFPMMHVALMGRLLLQSINQSTNYISCLWDSSGESTDNMRVLSLKDTSHSNLALSRFSQLVIQYCSEETDLGNNKI